MSIFKVSCYLLLSILDCVKIPTMANTKDTIFVNEIREKLDPVLKEKGLQVLMLFGSTVSGNRHKKSDIDLAFLFDRPVDILTLTNKVIRLLHTDNIDVVDLKNASPLMRFSIAKNGILIYEKEDGMFNKFYSLAFRRYIDTKKIRDAQETAIRHFLEVKGLL